MPYDIVRVSAGRINALSASKAARIIVESELDADNLRLLTTTGGRIDATVNADTLYISASENGTVNVGGQAQESSYYATQSGRITAYNLAAKNASIVAESSSRVDAYVIEELDARAYTEAGIYYKGDAKAQKLASSSGTVKKV